MQNYANHITLVRKVYEQIVNNNNNNNKNNDKYNSRILSM